MQDNPTGKHGDNRLQAHNQRGHGRVHALLPDDLQGIRCAGGQCACVQHRLPRGEQRTQTGLLKEQHARACNHSADKKLNAGHFHAVGQRRKMVDDHDMYRKQDGTDKGEEVAAVHAQPVGQTEKIQADDCQRHTAPDQSAAFAPEQKAEQRYNQDIAGGQKTGFADCSVQQADLLKNTRKAQRCAAAHTAKHQCFACAPFFFGVFVRMAWTALMQDDDDRQQNDTADHTARKQKGEWADIVHADALRHERHAPDGGGEQKNQGVSDFQGETLLLQRICTLHKKTNRFRRFAFCALR